MHDPDPDGHLTAMVDALIHGDAAHAAGIARRADEESAAGSRPAGDDGGDDDTDIWDHE